MNKQNLLLIYIDVYRRQTIFSRCAHIETTLQCFLKRLIGPLNISLSRALSNKTKNKTKKHIGYCVYISDLWY